MTDARNAGKPPPDAEMAAFDALPANLRAALRDTVQKWSAISAHQALGQGHPPHVVEKFVRQLDTKHVRSTTILCD